MYGSEFREEKDESSLSRVQRLVICRLYVCRCRCHRINSFAYYILIKHLYSSNVCGFVLPVFERSENATHRICILKRMVGVATCLGVSLH